MSPWREEATRCTEVCISFSTASSSLGGMHRSSAKRTRLSSVIAPRGVEVLDGVEGGLEGLAGAEGVVEGAEG